MMESSTSKAEMMMKPLFLKAGIGIPLALSVAGFTYAKITARKNTISPPKPSYEEDNEERLLGLRSRIEELQKKELELENKFLQYHSMKERESTLMEAKNMLTMEATHVEVLDREISSIEAENQRFQNLVIEFLKLVGQLKLTKLENGLLRRKVKKFSRKIMEQSRSIREKDMKMDAAEKEIFRIYNAVEKSDDVIKELEDQVEELQTIVNSLQEEKNELLVKLKIDQEGVTMEEYNKVVKELEQMRKDQASEIAELMYLKWNNACLRHELMRNHEQEQQEENQKHLEHEEIKNCILNENQGCSRRKKIFHKLKKKWVGGNEHVKVSKLKEKEKQEINQ